METHQQRRARKQTLVLAAVVLLAVVLGGATYAALDGQQRERARRASDVVTVALTEAQHLRGAHAWAEAQVAAEKAVALARDGDDALRERAQSALEAIAAEAGAARLKSEQVAREKAFLAELAEVRLEASEDSGSARHLARILAIFGAHGIDLEAPSQAIARIKSEWNVIRVELAAALDDRTQILRRHRLDWKDHDSIARGIDPDPWRRRLRDAVAARDVGAMEKLQREALERNDLSVRTLDLLSTALWNAKEPKLAIALLRNAWWSHPGDFWICTYLGFRLRMQGSPKEAIRFSEAAVSLRPESALAWHSLAHAYGDSGNHGRAEELFRKAGRLAPESSDHPDCLGRELAERGQYKRATAAYREAIRINPELAEAHSNLGNVLQRKGDFDGAIAAYREAIRINPEFANAHSNLGIALTDKGDLDGAIAACHEAIRINPELAEAHRNLSVALIRKGDLDGAIAACRKAIHINPDFAEALLNLGTALSRKGDLDNAIAAFREANRIKPDFADAHYNLGFTLMMRKGDLDGASRAFREAIRINPEYAEAHCNLGHSLSKAGRFKKALKSLRRGHELGSRRADWRYPSEKWIEAVEQKISLEARLPEVLAGRTEPKNAEECAEFADVCARSKRFADAVQLYAKAFEMGTTRPEHRYNAACSGVLTSTPKWRARALEWLRAELERHARDPAAAKATLQHWKRDCDLAAVRDQIDALPESERAGWRTLWADVDALLKRAVAK